MEKENENISFSVPDLKNYLDYKAYLAIGNNTWNIFIQYSFVPIFKGKFLQNKNSAEAYNVNIVIFLCQFKIKLLFLRPKF